MESFQVNIPTTSVTEAMPQNGSITNLNHGVLTPQDKNKAKELELQHSEYSLEKYVVIDNHDASVGKGIGKTQEFELQNPSYSIEKSMVIDNHGDTTRKENVDLDEWITPKCLLANLSDCQIVGNKLKSFFTEESQHSKWKEFRKLARNKTANEECPQLLRRMELQDSDEDEDENMEELINQVKEINQVASFEVNLEKKKPKRQRQWGPIQRIDRPRRYPEDGKTMMQRAQELKEYKNLCKGTKPALIITFESNDTIVSKSKYVNISLGYDDNMIVSNVNLIRDKDLAGRKEFIEKSGD